jgi:hypothetical protein
MMPNKSERTGGLEVAAELHFHERKLQATSPRRRHIQQVGTLSAGLLVLALAHRAEQFRHVVEGNEEALFEGKPGRPHFAAHRAMALRQRQRHHFLRHRAGLCQAQGEAAADRFQGIEQKGAVTRACRQAHFAQCGVQQAHDLVQRTGGRNELQEAQVVTLRHAVDQIRLIKARQIARRVEILDAGMPIHRHHPITQTVQGRQHFTAVGRYFRDQHRPVVVTCTHALGDATQQCGMRLDQTFGKATRHRMFLAFRRGWNGR